AGFDDAIALEVRASLRLFGPWPVFERRLRADLRELGFAHRIAVAPNPRAARVLAGVQDGLAIVHEARLQVALSRIPVARAGLEPKQAEALHAMGLRRLGQLFAAPRDALGKRFGTGLLQHLDRLRGAPRPARGLRAAGPLRPAHRTRPRGRDFAGAAVPVTAHDRRPRRLPGRPRRRRAALHRPARTRRPPRHRGRGRAAGRRTRSGAAVRTRAQPPGTGGDSGTGARPAPAGHAVAAVRACRARAVRRTPGAGHALGTAARAPARAPRRRRVARA